MNVSGILVHVRPDRFDDARAALAALPGLDVFQGDRPTGRLVVTQEAPSVGAEVAGLKRIQALPDVVAAELVYHRFDDEPSPARKDEEAAP